MQKMEAFGVPRRIVAFVMPTGYSFNLDGSTLYLALASVFVAQAAGIDMPLSQQLLMMATLMVTSKGVAAVPRASLVILSGALTQFGLAARRRSASFSASTPSWTWRARRSTSSATVWPRR